MNRFIKEFKKEKKNEYRHVFFAFLFNQTDMFGAEV